MGFSWLRPLPTPARPRCARRRRGLGRRRPAVPGARGAGSPTTGLGAVVRRAARGELCAQHAAGRCGQQARVRGAVAAQVENERGGGAQLRGANISRIAVGMLRRAGPKPRRKAASPGGEHVASWPRGPSLEPWRAQLFETRCVCRGGPPSPPTRAPSAAHEMGARARARAPVRLRAGPRARAGGRKRHARNQLPTALFGGLLTFRGHMV